MAAIALVLTGLLANIAVHDGGAVLVVIAAAALGVTGVVFGIFYLSGARVVKHAHSYRSALPGVATQIRALEAARRKDAQR